MTDVLEELLETTTTDDPAGVDPAHVDPAHVDGDVPAGIALRGVRHRYGTVVALDADALDIPRGALCAIVGPSGCGKSTLLALVSGLLQPTEGRIAIDDVDVTHMAPGERNLSMVFQDFALYPHMTVEDNISFGLRLEARHSRGAGPDRAAISSRVAEVCEQLEIGALRRRRPAQLSGGERQRVALARAIVRRRSVLLLDEPLSSLDAQLRQRARAELIRLHRELAATVVMVTHDQLEALSVATHLVVMRGGRVVQAGPPEQVYGRPADEFVATFLGSPAMNVLEPGLVPSRPRARVGWRPADATFVDPADDGGSGALELGGDVDVVEYTGDARVVHCVGDGGRWAVVEPLRGTRTVGEHVLARIPADGLHLFDADTGQRLDV